LQAGGRGFDSSPLSLLEGGRGDGRSSSPGHVDSLGGNARLDDHGAGFGVLTQAPETSCYEWLTVFDDIRASLVMIYE
jgi:hypothetical protein